MREMLAAILPRGWEAGFYGDTVECPCGFEIELDGTCPEGCESPVLGLV